MVFEKLKAYRKKAGFSQDEIASLLKITKSAICGKEIGRRSWSIREAVLISKAIAEKLDQPIESIFYDIFIKEIIAEETEAT